MNKRQTIRTMLLGLAVILITCTIFVSLFSQIPSCGKVSTRLLIQGCKQSSSSPLSYATYIWDEYAQPTFQASDFPQFDESGHLLTDDENLARLSGLKSKIIVTPDSENDNRITVSGYLLYFSGGEVISPLTIPFLHWMGGLSNRTVEIVVESHFNGHIDSNNVSKVTDKNGFFSATFEFSESPECYWVFVNYPGEVFGTARPGVIYTSCGAVYGTCESMMVPEKSRWWIWLIIGLVVSISAVILYWYLKRKKGTMKPGTIPIPDIENAEVPEVKKKQEIDSGGDTHRVDIYFPDIENTLPAVYGVNDILRVRISRRNTRERGLSRVCEVNWGGEETVRFLPEGKPTGITHVYREKKTYRITVCDVDSSGNDISVWRTIRIVDYREEMVRLFGEMLEKLNLADIEIGADMTPREVERLLSERLENVPKESIRKVIKGFEEANYSTHPVDRESYVRMYKAIGEVTRRSD